MGTVDMVADLLQNLDAFVAGELEEALFYCSVPLQPELEALPLLMLLHCLVRSSSGKKKIFTL